MDHWKLPALALANGLVEVSKRISNASVEWLEEGLVILPEARRARLVASAHERLNA